MKTYSKLVGYFTGISWMFSPYAMPFVMYNTGLVVSIITLIVTAIASFIPIMWILETMCRAQAMKTIEDMKTDIDIQNVGSVKEVLSLCRIKTGRRFELQELCKVFIGKPAAIFCSILVVVYLCNWTDVVISATALATNAPVSSHGTFLAACTEEDFHFDLHPVGACWNTYTLSVLVFGGLSLVVALTELGEMRLLQTVLAIVRFSTIGSMIAYSIFTVNKDDVHDRNIPWFQFSLRGFLAAVPTIVYAHLTIIGVPTISDPVAKKQGLANMWAGIFFTTSSFCGLLGLTVAARFRSSVNEVASLNWVPLTDSSSIALRIFAYWIVLYPSAEQIVSSGMTSIILANTFESLLFDGHKQSRLKRSIHRLFWTAIRLIAPIFVSNLVAESKYVSLVLFWLMYFIPGLLQYRSRNRWFAEIKRVAAAAPELIEHHNATESTGLISSELNFINDTPYSGWYSRPVVVVAVQVFGLLAFSLTVLGLALPHSLS